MNWKKDDKMPEVHVDENRKQGIRKWQETSKKKKERKKERREVL
jgi:hypothetical protein